MSQKTRIYSKGFIIVDEEGDFPTGFFSVEREGVKKVVLKYIAKDDFDILFDEVLSCCVLYSRREAIKKQRYLQEKSSAHIGVAKKFYVKEIEI